MAHILENEYYKIEFDECTGAVTGILQKVTAWQVIKNPALSMGIQLLVPIEQHRNNRVLSANQRLASLNKTNKEAILTWEGVYGDKSGMLDIPVKLAVTLEDESAIFQISVENHSPYVIEEIWCPCIGGFREPQGEQPFESMTLNMCGGLQRTYMGDGFPQGSGYWGTYCPTFISNYPSGAVITPFVILSNGNTGLYLGMHTSEYQLVNFVHELKPGFSDSKHNRVPKTDEICGKQAGYTLSAVRIPFIQPGESAEMAPMVLRLYSGSWHHGVRTYTDWSSRWYEQSPQPSWLEEVDCWMTLHMNSPEGCCIYKYSDLVDIACEAKEKGVQAIQLIGWARDGQDGAEPYQDTDPRLGTREELKQAICEIEKVGVRMLLMCKFKWADWTIPEYHSEMEKYAVKDMYGNIKTFGGYSYQTMTQQLGLGIRSGACLCHASEEYRAVALREFEKLLDLGSSGMLYDELLPFPICFDRSHDHRYGECTMNGSLNLAEDFYNLAKMRNGEFLMTAEGPDDRLARYYAVNYMRTSDYYYWVSKHTPAWKYMHPEMKMATCIIGFDDREMINQCIAYGYIINYEPYNFKGRITDITGTVEYGQKAQNLRRRLWDYLWKGRFMDTEGAVLKADEKNSDLAFTVFENKLNGKKAVVVINDSPDRGYNGCVVLDNGNREFELFTVEDSPVTESDGEVLVAPRSLVVLVEKKQVGTVLDLPGEKKQVGTVLDLLGAL